MRLTRRVPAAPVLTMATLAVLAVSACSVLEEPAATDPPEAGVAVPTTPKPAPIAYSPLGRDALAYALPTAVSGKTLQDSPAAVIAADEKELEQDPLIKRSLQELGLGPSIITVVQRGTSHTEVPDVSVTAVQFKGLPAADYADFVPSVYLLATSVTMDQHNFTSAKPPRRAATIEGRKVQTADWGDFDTAWYPHGDVVFIVLAKNPQLMAAALRSLPPF